MNMALGAKCELRFIDGSCKKPGLYDIDTDDCQRWVRGDYMVRRWLLNSMISNISEIFMYVESVRQFWEPYLLCNKVINR